MMKSYYGEAATDLPSINVAKTTKMDGSLCGERERDFRGFPVDFRDTLRLPRGSETRSHGKCTSLLNVRPEDRQAMYHIIKRLIVCHSDMINEDVIIENWRIALANTAI
ncbi:uncharacterized protein LOC109611126 [Ooceraea biroi]|uniref:uncharacterized protein LOC109611126 n=1 Tax=Ooceraea biroi TaxID=2015173 RepID=UPI000F08F234|nr:uncharacterized protein LOC109611126 [Ooceraea biroi]